ncbi:MAG: hypothetical protein ACD_33C00026G0001 [uncultured bacterium]|nr:MAG: hypothetical protein ACD_33C00026G0001 [uncultured bacterium]
MKNNLLNERPMSGFPLSIATSLALETLFNPVIEVFDTTREVPPKAKVSDYSVFIFNINTLLRNIITSVPYIAIREVKFNEVLDILLEEIDFLTNFFNNNNMYIKFYINNYSYVKKTYDIKKLRNATTEKQLYIDQITAYCLDKIVKEDNVDKFTKDVKYHKEDNGLIFTHVPYDLLSYDNFTSLALLESHTGLIKTRKTWNSKYYPLPNKDMSTLPFFEYLLITFGDNVMFHPDPLKERLELYEALIKKKVHPMMSDFSLSILLK